VFTRLLAARSGLQQPSLVPREDLGESPLWPVAALIDHRRVPLRHSTAGAARHGRRRPGGEGTHHAPRRHSLGGAKAQAPLLLRAAIHMWLNIRR
jgi:hypothetical protein